MVFLDLSRQRQALLRVAALSALAGLAAWCAMLVLVRFLGRRAIRPMAENMQRQRQFVTDAGHELKTPLAIIQANAEALELTGGESKYSRNIRAQVARLTDLTQNLLTLARLDEAGAAPGLTELDLTEPCRRALESFRAPAEQKGLRLTADIAPNVTVLADREQMKQLLSILLDNAVKYCPEGGEIALTLRREDRATLRLPTPSAGQSADPGGSSTASTGPTAPAAGRPAATASASPRPRPSCSCTRAASAPPTRASGSSSPCACLKLFLVFSFQC